MRPDRLVPVHVGSIAGFTPAVFAIDPKGKELGDEVKKIDDTLSRSSNPSRTPVPAVLTIFGLLIYDKETMEANKTDKDPWSHDYVVNNVNARASVPIVWTAGRRTRKSFFSANPITTPESRRSRR